MPGAVTERWEQLFCVYLFIFFFFNKNIYTSCIIFSQGVDFFSGSDLELMFPSAPTNPITVVTVTHQSSQGGEAAERDRDQLLQRVSLHLSLVITGLIVCWKASAHGVCVPLLQFVSGAKEMCFSLWTAGYWADFIDPATGTAVSSSRRTPQRF